MDSSYLEVIAILLLILANGFFSLAEFSIIASRRSKLKQLAQKGSRAAALASKIQSRPENFLATVQLGITVVGVLAGVFGGMTLVGAIAPYIGAIGLEFISVSARTISFFIVVIAISFLTVVLGELVPKYLALSKPERLASVVARPMLIFGKISFFVVQLLYRTARLVLRLFGLKRIPERSSISDEEINLIIAEGREKGHFSAMEQQLVHSVFDFSDITAHQAMTHRTDIIAIDENDSTETLLKKITESGFSRYPVFQGNLDNIIGIIYTKDIISILQESRPIAIKDIIRKPQFIPDSMKLITLLRTFQQKKVHLAVVLDEFGGTAGLITLEDLLEEIVGEIQDEHDTEQREFVMESESVAFASASYRIDELNDSFGTNISEDGPETLGGLIFETLKQIPAKGVELKHENLLIRVLEVEGNRIKRVRLEKIQT
jgi:putative hemolysin